MRQILSKNFEVEARFKLGRYSVDESVSGRQDFVRIRVKCANLNLFGKLSFMKEQASPVVAR